MTKVSAEIRKNGGLEREGEGKETRRRIQGERRGNSRRTKQAEEKRRVV